MFRRSWVLIAALIAFEASAVTMEEKVNRVQYLKELSEKVPSMDVEAYERELNYERLNLSLEDRVHNESSLIAEKIKNQILKAFEAAKQKNGEAQAVSEIRNAIERDTTMLSENMQEDIRAFSFKVLDDIQKGFVTSTSDLKSLEDELAIEIQDRMDFLNEEAPVVPLEAHSMNENAINPTTKNDSDRKIYNNKKELLESLVSTRENAGWSSTSSTTMKSMVLKKIDNDISLNVRAEFLGVSLNYGPQFKFTREFNTLAFVMTEGMSPAVASDGNFDLYLRDRAGNILKTNGKAQKRKLFFWCETNLIFETNINTGGGFSVAGVGGGSRITGIYNNAVNLNSRRVALPEFINGKTATMAELSKLCHNDFLTTKVTNNLTIQQSLNIMMKNIVSNLRYSNSKSKCGQDSQCVGWFKKNLSLNQKNNYPRCLESGREKFYTCEIRGLTGQSCPVYDAKGKRVSSGQNEFFCDAGLKCVKTSEGGIITRDGIFQKAKGQCRPVNSKTYKAPRAIR